jgi:hypothetical protein
MTEEQLDLVYEVRQRIERAITALVRKELLKQPLTPAQDDLIRTQLTENYRFWE